MKKAPDYCVTSLDEWRHDWILIGGINTHRLSTRNVRVRTNMCVHVWTRLFITITVLHFFQNFKRSFALFRAVGLVSHSIPLSCPLYKFPILSQPAFSPLSSCLLFSWSIPSRLHLFTLLRLGHPVLSRFFILQLCLEDFRFIIFFQSWISRMRSSTVL